MIYIYTSMSIRHQTIRSVNVIRTYKPNVQSTSYGR